MSGGDMFRPALGARHNLAMIDSAYRLSFF